VTATPGRHPWIRSVLAGLLVSAVGTVVAPFGWALVPGMVLSWALFPEGVHTGSGVGAEYFVVILLASVAAWSAVLFVLSMLWKVVRRQSGHGPAA
jgi:hypothetical protein